MTTADRLMQAVDKYVAAKIELRLAQHPTQGHDAERIRDLNSARTELADLLHEVIP